MRKSLTQQRTEAVGRALDFLYSRACDPESFEAYGHDFLFCFYTIASNSKDENVRRTARRMGRERARVWRNENPSVQKDVSASSLSNLVAGSDAADRLGVRDEHLKHQIRRALKRFTAEDFYGFDPLREPPPDDVPEDCECGAGNRRGRQKCRWCGRRLRMIGRYGTWIDALVVSYLAERYGVPLGASYREVIKWRPLMLPYRGAEKGRNPDFYWTFYAVTHVIYTLNHYNVYQLSPRWLPEEFEFLKSNLDEAIRIEDPEMAGEFLDSLKAFGLKENHPLVSRATKFVLPQQEPDGGWLEAEATNSYQRYHPAFTAINGLRDIAWRGVRLSFPKLKRMIEKWNENGKSLQF